MDTKKLLETRARIKRKKPVFGRKDNNKKKRIEPDVWRKARGCDNKQRLKRKGHKKSPKQGFRSPVEIRGFDESGLKPFVVTHLNQIHTLTKEHGVIVSSNLGDRKRKLVLEEAAKKGLKVLNLDSAKTLEQINAGLSQRQQQKKKEEETKKAKDKDKKDKEHKHDQKAEKKEADSELSEEEKKKLEKEEKDKLLTTKQ